MVEIQQPQSDGVNRLEKSNTAERNIANLDVVTENRPRVEDSSPTASSPAESDVSESSTWAAFKFGVPDEKSVEAPATSHGPPDPAGEAERAVWRPSTRETLTMATLTIISLMTALEATTMVTSLEVCRNVLRRERNNLITSQSISHQMDLTTVEAFWIGTSYLVAYTVVMPVIAACSDPEAFGRFPCLLMGLTLFTVGSIVCSLAPSFAVLTSGRIVQGLGGGGITVLTLLIFTDIVALAYRPLYYSLIQAAWAIGACFGPLLGGLFSQRLTWRWIFYLMFPFCAVGVGLFPFLIRNNENVAAAGGGTFRTRLAKIDWFRGLIFTLAITAFLVGTSRGGTQKPWKSLEVSILLGSGAAGIILFSILVPRQKESGKIPFFKQSLWTVRSSIVYMGAFSHGIMLYTGLYYYPFFFQLIQAASPIHAGAALLPVTTTMLLGAVGMGRLVTRWGISRWTLPLSWAVTALGTGLTILFDGETPLSQWSIFFVLIGCGQGALLTALNVVTQGLANAEDRVHAATMFVSARTAGMTVVGPVMSIFVNIAKLALRAHGHGEDLAATAVQMSHTASLWPTSDQGSILASYEVAFRAVFIFLTCIAALNGMASVFVGGIGQLSEM